MFSTLFNSSRKTKRLIALSYDATAIAGAIYLSICLRIGSITLPFSVSEAATLSITVLSSVIIFAKLGLYRAILRYMTIHAFHTILLGCLASATILATSSFFLNSFIPRSVPLIYIFTALFFISAPRFLIRSTLLLNHRDTTNKEAVIIYGAGYSGHKLAQSIQATPYKVVAFVDDNPAIKGTTIDGVTVYSSREIETLMQEFSCHKILLALGQSNRQHRAAVIKRLESLPLIVQTIPAMPDILSGKSKIEDVQDVEIEDLLGRDTVDAQPELMHACIENKVVMVTGAGGSIGSELCRQIIKQRPSTLVLFELNEYSLYTIEQELNNVLATLNKQIKIIALIGSVQKKTRLETIMKSFSVQTVYHAAAYKHVPLVEHNIIEGARNNIFGTWFCAEAAISAGVESFVLISTDKAVRPTNIMGATKRMAELILQGLSKRQNNTRFTMVRFGNVLGSSGSVVPLFRRQIKQGGPITVTHPDIIRYFMTIPEASALVIQAGSMGLGGDVFVLDMGDPVKITDLARKMVRLSGLSIRDTDTPDGDIEILFSGLRPGEKLFEELLIGDTVSGTDHPRIMRAEEVSLSWQDTKEYLTSLDSACHNFECVKVKNLLIQAPTAFTPSELNIQDHVWQHREQNHDSPPTLKAKQTTA